MENVGVNLTNPEPIYQDAGIFNGLFPNIVTDDSITNKYTEVYRPLEPVLEDSLIYNICVLKKPTNTWTAISQADINCGFKFQKQVADKEGILTWQPVKKEDKAVPCSGMIQSFWEEIDIRLNQTRVGLYIILKKNIIFKIILGNKSLSQRAVVFNNRQTY